MNVTRDGLELALANLLRKGTCDLLPVSPLLAALHQDKAYVLDELAGLDLQNHVATTPEQILVPKSSIGYRLATSLHPVDFLLFTAMVNDMGPHVEGFRAGADRVFSARFRPSPPYNLLFEDWEGFRQKSIELANHAEVTYIVSLDFVDCYNQLGTHRANNALQESGVAQEASDCLEKRFLIPFNLKSSQGIPVGSDAGRLIAEAALAMVDQWLASRSLEYVRYVDDIRVFLRDWKSVIAFCHDFHELINRETLKLAINDEKSRVFKKETFLGLERIDPAAREDSERFKRYRMKVEEALEWVKAEWWEEVNIYEAVTLDAPAEEDIDPEVLKSLEKEALVESIQQLFEEAFVDGVDASIIKHLLGKLTASRSSILIGATLDKLNSMGSLLPLVIRYYAATSNSFTEQQREKLAEYLLNGQMMTLPFYKKWFSSLLFKKVNLLGLDASCTILDLWGEVDPEYRWMAGYLKKDLEYVRTKKQGWALLHPLERMWFIQAAHFLPEGEKNAFLGEVVAQSPLYERCLARCEI